MSKRTKAKKQKQTITQTYLYAVTSMTDIGTANAADNAAKDNKDEDNGEDEVDVREDQNRSFPLREIAMHTLELTGKTSSFWS